MPSTRASKTRSREPHSFGRIGAASEQTRCGSHAARWGLPRAAAVLVGSGLLCLCSSAPAHAYIGPGAGFAVLGSFLVVLAALVLGGMVLLTWPLRFLLRYRRRRRAYARSQVKRVVILGFDGMDPEIVDGMMAAGRLPNLAKLAEGGTYVRLATTCPAMSPVAWSSFMTGTGPGRHAIFDFLHRDPRTYLPDLSSARIRPPRRMLRLGSLQIPLGRPSVRLLRRSKPFWSVLSDHGVFSTVLRVPITFPPERFNGLLLSGMCVPDLRGTQGSFTFFTSGSGGPSEHIGGERIDARRENGVFRAALPGPPRMGSAEGEPATTPFRVSPDGNGNARLDIAGQRVVLRRGELSDWVPVGFALGPGMRANGICRFLLKQIEPELELYVTPINIDPERPALPVSHPMTYAIYLAKRLGRYATLGLAEDTWALNEGVLDEESFLQQCQLYFEERERMLFNALGNLREGCVVCVFDTTDRVQHMFWRYREADHPANEGKESTRFREAVEQAYEQSDELLGRVMEKSGERDAVFVMSDHGFGSFRRGVNLNAWLRDNGYLTLKPDTTGESEWLRDVDWERTRAYAVGLGGLYLNVKGREAQGIVPPSEAEELKRELIGKLTGLLDDALDTTAVDRVFDTAEVNPGPYANVGPDLTIGYALGYRASWDAAQGKASGPVIADNTRRWSGDHCVDPSRVPGVLFSNRPLEGAQARIVDVAPTVLSLFGIETPGYMEGRSLLGETERERSA